MTMIPTYEPHTAPDGLATFRQLRAADLRPNGADPVAQLVWPKSGSWGALYDISSAVPVRPMTPGRRRAVEAMLLARQWCPRCDTDVGYRLRTRLGMCEPCALKEGL